MTIVSKSLFTACLATQLSSSHRMFSNRTTTLFVGILVVST